MADPTSQVRASTDPSPTGVHYKWIALTNTTLGVLMATLNGSITLISLPAIFRGLNLQPLVAGNVSYLLWLLMGYLVVSAVFVVALGRLGDMRGRVRIYNAGFAVFTIGSVALALDPLTGGAGAMWLIIWRIVQGFGGAMLAANSTAIVTDAFPVTQRGLALGVNQVAGLAGSFIGLVAGGLLSVWDWRAVFFLSVPIGVLGTVWAYRSLREIGVTRRARFDYLGNGLWAVGLVALLVAITYGIQPYGGSTEGWGNPLVLAGLVGGVAVLIVFCIVELRVKEPMFNIRLFRGRAFAAGTTAGLLASIARGGLQFMLIIWLQGIWLPLHGYSFQQTPLWAGIYLLPLTIGFLVAGPLSGFLSDRWGARFLATAGLLVAALSFLLLMVLPVNFAFPAFAALIFINGVGSGLFSAPNIASIMNSVPPGQRGAAGGLQSTATFAGMTLSIGIFFSLMVQGLAGPIKNALFTGLHSHGVPAQLASAISSIPPVGSLFAAFLGYNPLGTLLNEFGVKPSHLPPGTYQLLTSKEYFPGLISNAFHQGLIVVFAMAAGMMVLAAICSVLRGGRSIYVEPALEKPAAATASKSE
ncbi:MAG: MFS transporter [Candidatus Dormibacteraeota bacterium]|nr:MFS transporter [Candidatus Dormibacteraeota bacterium]